MFMCSLNSFLGVDLLSVDVSYVIHIVYFSALFGHVLLRVTFSFAFIERTIRAISHQGYLAASRSVFRTVESLAQEYSRQWQAGASSSGRLSGT